MPEEVLAIHIAEIGYKLNTSPDGPFLIPPLDFALSIAWPDGMRLKPVFAAQTNPGRPVIRGWRHNAND